MLADLLTALRESWLRTPGLLGEEGATPGVGEVGGKREGEVRHHDCVAGGGDLGGMVVSGGLMEG